MNIDFKTFVPQGLELPGAAFTASGVLASEGVMLKDIGDMALVFPTSRIH